MHSHSMTPSGSYSTTDYRRPGQPSPEEGSPSWITISEPGRPLSVRRGLEQYPDNRMNSKYAVGASRYDGSFRMFDGPIGPSPEEDQNAPFYVPPRNRTPPSGYYQHEFRGFPEASHSHHPDDQGDRRFWSSDTAMNEDRRLYTDRESWEDERSSHSVQRNMPSGRRPSTFPYPKQSRQRDQSRERFTPPNVPKSRRNNTAHSSRHRRRAASITRKQSSREASVSNTSQLRRQFSHDEVAPPRPLSRPDLSPTFNHSYERAFSSPDSVPHSPISNPSVAGRSWNGTPPHRMEDTSISQAISILNQMLQSHSRSQILRHWKTTGQGPNPYDYPQWEGWFRDSDSPRPLSPRTMRGDGPWVAPPIS